MPSVTHLSDVSGALGNKSGIWVKYVVPNAPYHRIDRCVDPHGSAPQDGMVSHRVVLQILATRAVCARMGYY